MCLLLVFIFIQQCAAEYPILPHTAAFSETVCTFPTIKMARCCSIALSYLLHVATISAYVGSALNWVSDGISSASMSREKPVLKRVVFDKRFRRVTSLQCPAMSEDPHSKFWSQIIANHTRLPHPNNIIN